MADVADWPVDLRGETVFKTLDIVEVDIAPPGGMTGVEDTVLRMTARRFNVSIDDILSSDCKSLAVIDARGAALLVLKMLGVGNGRQLQLFGLRHASTLRYSRQKIVDRLPLRWLVEFYAQVLLALRHPEDEFRAPLVGANAKPARRGNAETGHFGCR